MQSQVKIVQEGIPLRADIDKAGIKPRHEFVYLAQIDIPDRKRGLALLVLVLDQILVLKKGYGYVFLLYVND